MKKTYRYELGKKIRKCREDMCLTQEQAAELCGISPSFYSNLERGSRAMSLDTLMAISEAFSVSFDYLLGEVRELPERSLYSIIEEAKRSGDIQYEKYLRAIKALATAAEHL